MNVLLGVVVFGGFIYLVHKFIIAYSTKLLSFFVSNNHKYADEIITSGYVPVDWLVDVRGKKPRTRKRMNKVNALRRIRKIEKYFRHTSMVETEEVRAHILLRLKSVRKLWEQATWESLIPPNIHKEI